MIGKMRWDRGRAGWDDPRDWLEGTVMMDRLLTCVLKVLCSGERFRLLAAAPCSCVVCRPLNTASSLLEPPWASAAPLGLPPRPPLGVHCRGISWGLPPCRVQRQCVRAHVGGPRAHTHLSPARAAILAGVTGGLAAPLVAAGAATIIGTAGAAALGSAAGIAIMTSLFGAAGAGLTGKAPEQRWSWGSAAPDGPAL